MSRQLVLALLALLAAALVAPAAAPASSRQVMTFEAPGQLLDDSAREATLDEIQSFGVQRVRALVYWRDFSARPNSKRPPSFDRSDHTAYPQSVWGPLDRLVDSVQRRGMELQLTLTGPGALQRGFGHWFTWSAFAPASRSAQERRTAASRLAGPHRVRIAELGDPGLHPSASSHLG